MGSYGVSLSLLLQVLAVCSSCKVRCVLLSHACVDSLPTRLAGTGALSGAYASGQLDFYHLRGDAEKVSGSSLPDRCV